LNAGNFLSEGQYGVTEKIKTTETTEGKIKECGNWGHPRRDSMGRRIYDTRN
jgi:hypothetical protein